MKTSNELKSGLSQITMSATPAYRSHSSFLFSLQRAIPTHKSQLSKFNGLDCLCAGDITLIDYIFAESGLNTTADYRFTKSKGFVRLVNFAEFKTAITAFLSQGKIVKKFM